MVYELYLSFKKLCTFISLPRQEAFQLSLTHSPFIPSLTSGCVFCVRGLALLMLGAEGGEIVLGRAWGGVAASAQKHN